MTLRKFRLNFIFTDLSQQTFYVVFALKFLFIDMWVRGELKSFVS